MANISARFTAPTPPLQVDPVVSAAVYYSASLYYKARKDFTEFYKSSLLYLAFVSSDSLDPEYKLVRSRAEGHLLWGPRRVERYAMCGSVCTWLRQGVR